MKKTWIVAAALVALTAVAVPFVYAHGREGHDALGAGAGLGPLSRLHRMRHYLDLSDAQVEQIHAIVADVHTQNSAYRHQIVSGMNEAAQLLLVNPENVSGAQAVLKQQAAAEQAARANILKGVASAIEVLTPDQRAKLAKFLEEHHRDL